MEKDKIGGEVVPLPNFEKLSSNVTKTAIEGTPWLDLA